MVDAPAHLLDTNILLRLARRDDAAYSAVRTAVETLQHQHSQLCYALQNLIEFWNVATRPAHHNGFGLTVEEADREAHLIENQLTLIPDNHQIYSIWRSLVVAHSVTGVQV